jgi:hypothetical protein
VEMEKERVDEWHKRFRDGRASVIGNPRIGRPATSTNDDSMEHVQNVVRSDRWRGIQEISAEAAMRSVRENEHETAGSFCKTSDQHIGRWWSKVP